MNYDPNISDYWGRSLDLMWSNRFDTPGNLGGAIWGMIDEIFYLKDTVSSGNDLQINLDNKTGELQQAWVNKKQLINGAVKPVINKPVKPFDLYRTGEIFSGEYKIINARITGTVKFSLLSK